MAGQVFDGETTLETVILTVRIMYIMLTLEFVAGPAWGTVSAPAPVRTVH